MDFIVLFSNNLHNILVPNVSIIADFVFDFKDFYWLSIFMMKDFYDCRIANFVTSLCHLAIEDNFYCKTIKNLLLHLFIFILFMIVHNIDTYE